jgi:DNA-binding HxlR family transcriptional regulator
MNLRKNHDSVDYFPDISDYENTEHIFFELASEHRLQILFRLHNEKTKLARLARDLGVTMQEVHRNLNRLTAAGLIGQDSMAIFHFPHLEISLLGKYQLSAFSLHFKLTSRNISLEIFHSSSYTG